MQRESPFNFVNIKQHVMAMGESSSTGTIRDVAHAFEETDMSEFNRHPLQFNADQKENNVSTQHHGEWQMTWQWQWTPIVVLVLDCCSCPGGAVTNVLVIRQFPRLQL